VRLALTPLGVCVFDVDSASLSQRDSAAPSKSVLPSPRLHLHGLGRVSRHELSLGQIASAPSAHGPHGSLCSTVFSARRYEPSLQALPLIPPAYRFSWLDRPGARFARRVAMTFLFPPTPNQMAPHAFGKSGRAENSIALMATLGRSAGPSFSQKAAKLFRVDLTTSVSGFGNGRNKKSHSKVLTSLANRIEWPFRKPAREKRARWEVYAVTSRRKS
jgi:hypothetical protein